MKINFISLICLFYSSFSFGLSITPYSEKVFAEEKNQSYILHFYAEWCSICQHQKKILAEMKKDKELSDVKVFVVDFDLEKMLKEKYDIERQSSFVAIKNGTEVGRSLGVREKDSLSRLFKRTLASSDSSRVDLNKLKSELKNP